MSNETPRLFRFVEEPLRRLLIPTLIDVDHDLRSWCVSAPGVDTLNASRYKTGEAGPVVWQTAIRPQEAACDLVSDLHHLRHHSGSSEGVNRISGVCEDGGL